METEAKNYNLKIAESMRLLKGSQFNAIKSLALLLLREIELMRDSEGIKLLKGENEEAIDFYQEMQRFEVNLIRCAIIQSGGNQTKAAKILGIRPSTLNEKIRRLKIDISSKESDS